MMAASKAIPTVLQKPIGANNNPRPRISTATGTFRRAVVKGYDHTSDPSGEGYQGHKGSVLTVRLTLLGLTELGEEGVIDFVCRNGAETKLKILEHVDELLAVNELDWWNSVSSGFAPGFGGEGTSCDDDSLVGTTCHSTTEVADVRRRH